MTMLLCLIAVLLNIHSIFANFSVVPSDIYSHQMGYLSLAEQVSFGQINRKCKHCFEDMTKIQQIRDLRAVIHIANDTNIDSLLANLTSITRVIGLNELLSYYIPAILKQIRSKRTNHTLSIPNMHKLLRAINMRPVVDLERTKQKYQKEQVIFVVSLFCISSRSIIDRQLNIAPLFNTFPKPTVLWFIYVYQHIIKYYADSFRFNRTNMFSSKSAIYLNKKYGLLLWNDDQLNKLKRQNLPRYLRGSGASSRTSVFGLHTEFGRLHTFMLRAPDFHWIHGAEFQTTWLLEAVEEYELPLVHGYINPSILRHKRIWITTLAEQNFKMDRFKEFEKIIKLLAVDEIFSRDCLSNILYHSFDVGFTERALAILCNIRDDWQFMDAINVAPDNGILQLLIRHIPQRQLQDASDWNQVIGEIKALSAHQWLDDDIEGSKSTISFLAMDKYFKNYHVTNLTAQLSSMFTNEDTKMWIRSMIDVLYQARNDWNNTIYRTNTLLYQ
eukprot:291960_1